MPWPRQSGSTQRRFTSPTPSAPSRLRNPTPPTGSGDDRRGGRRGRHPRGIEHGGGQPQLARVEARRSAATSSSSAWATTQRGPVVAVGLGRQHGARRNGEGGPMHTLYPFRDSRGARSRAAATCFPVFSPVPPDIDFVALEQGRIGPLGGAPRLRALHRAAGGCATVGLLRGTADGQRHAGAPPRLGPGLQGPVLPVPHDGRAPTSPAGPGGTPMGSRSRSRSRRSSASPASSRSRSRSASPSSPGCAASRSTPTSTSSPA